MVENLRRILLANFKFITQYYSLLEKEWQPTPVFCPAEVHGQRSLMSYSSWGRKESDMTEHICTLFTTVNILYLRPSEIIHPT